LQANDLLSLDPGHWNRQHSRQDLHQHDGREPITACAISALKGRPDIRSSPAARWSLGRT
jgi:hypothetical protein